MWGPGNRGQVPALFGPPPAPPVTAPDNPTPGTAEMVDLLVRALATDFNDRAFDNRQPAPAYRFDSEDGSAVSSGDTAPSDNLVPLARDTDVLVHEVVVAD